jgi:hypothetical protein
MMKRTVISLFATTIACSSEEHHGDPVPESCSFDGAEIVPNEGWSHVDDGTAIDYAHNPPASGPHFRSWASYTVHTDVVPRGNWVHNVEHGAIVLLVGDAATDDEAQLLHDAAAAIPIDEECGHNRVLLTRDPLLNNHVAAVAADRVMAGDRLAVDDIVAFALACRNHAPENVCQ